MHRILLVIKSDGIGGVERQVARLLDTFGRRSIRCDLVALAPSAHSRGLLADHPVLVLAPGPPSGPLRRLAQLVQLRALLGRHAYDLVLAFGPSANALVSLARPRRTVAVIAEVGNPFVRHRRLWNRTMMWSYRRADALLVHTERLADDLRSAGRVLPPVVVCPPVLGDRVPLVAPSAPRKPAIVTVGRLIPSKRVDDLIAAFALVADRFPVWTLTIVGDGSDRQALQDLAAARRVRDRVTFTGFLDEPWRLLAESSIFAFSSAHEGFSNVLLEAAASGCAIVSSDCRYGPREILDDGQRGLLYAVGDVAQLAACLARFMEDEGVRRAFAERAHEGIARYRPGIEDPWVDLLATLAGGSRR